MKKFANILRKQKNVVLQSCTRVVSNRRGGGHGFTLAKQSASLQHKAVLLVFGLLIVFVSMFIIQRVFLSQTHADGDGYPHGPVEAASVSLSTPEDVTIDLTPTPNGDNIGISSNSTTVSTNNVNGYSLTLNTNYDSASDESNKLVHMSLDAHYIEPLATNNTELIASTWGYTTTDPTATPTTSLFSTVPTKNSPTTIKTTTASNVSSPDITTVYYGAKVSFSKPAGNYQNTVIYTGITNPVDGPTVTNINPNTGSLDGGDTITITGTNFDSLVNITIDGNECTNISITSATTATCTTPAGTVGAKDIIVTNQGGSVTSSGGFTYQNPAPQVTSISPNSGHFRGGETFTITGAGFTGATNVNFGGSDCRSFTVVSDTQIKCVSSGVSTSLQTDAGDGSGSFMTNATNVVSVNVTTANGTNTTNSLFTYRYPNSSFTAGNSYIDVKGTEFGLGSRFKVGGTNCKLQKITGAGTAACVTPSLTAGTGKAVGVTAPATATGNIQNFSETCTVAKIGTVRVLTDTRDGQNYRVRCMEDAHWWMIDNLKLKGGTTLNASNTDLDGTQGTDFVAKWTTLSAPVQDTASHSNGVCTSHSTVTIANGSGYLTCNGASYADTNDGFVAYSDPSAASTYTAWVCNNQIMINEESLTNCGYLYNWYTTTAGSGTYAKTSGTYATASICPAGWSLPYDDATNDFGVLNNSMLNNTPSASATTSSSATRPNWRYNGKFQGSLSGNYSASFLSQGNSGYYWSGRAASATNAVNLNFSYNVVNSGSINFSKYYGAGIRCIL